MGGITTRSPEDETLLIKVHLFKDKLIVDVQDEQDLGLGNHETAGQAASRDARWGAA